VFAKSLAEKLVILKVKYLPESSSDFDCKLSDPRGKEEIKALASEEF
jgi:hypothetical protein